MTETEERKCERCENEENNPVGSYDPRTPGHPHKRVNLCDVCAAADPRVVRDEAVVIPAVSPVLEGKALDEAVAEIREEDGDENEIETIKFEPSREPKEPIEEAIVTPKSKVPKASDNKAKDVETKPVDRVDIENKIKQHENDLNKLFQSRQELRAKLGQTSTLIDATKGAVAGLRDLLGNS